jgi:transcriptional regulator with XRE-family HTH domain
MSKKVTPSSISPEDIRALRESLGLSQAEAGELLGGGPRAFTKYEAGTIKPAQSVVNLLRLLESDPSVLATLTGKKSVPIPNAGQRPFEVTGHHVQALTERELVAVLRKVLSAEAREVGVAEAGVHVAGSINAPDAGEDGRIEWTDGPERTDFIPGRLTQFQLKAGRIFPGDAAAEVVSNRNSIKPMVEDVLTRGGSYILICGERYVQKEIQDRESRIRAALRGAGLSIRDEQVSFRDADQMAAWINHHPGVASWVLERTQPGLTGPFRTWSHWSGNAEHEGSPWVLDARLPELRRRLMEKLPDRQAVLRIVGRSGVGKSRLLLEALGPTDEDDAIGHSLSDLVLYADEGQAGYAQILTAAERLALSGRRAILVVDRCPLRTHIELENFVRRKGSSLSLVTINDDMGDEQMGIDVIEVGTAPDGVVEGVIANVAPGLEPEDHRRLVRFSRGFPKVAHLVARAWIQNLPVARATNETLVDSILLGRAPISAEKTRSVAEIIGALGLISMESGGGSEIADMLPMAGGLTEADFRRVVEDLSRRRIIQRRGRFAVLQPRPIALSLAERKWQGWSPADWDRMLAGDLPSELRVRAAKQLALLNDTPTAEAVVAHVCRYDGPLASAEGVTSRGNAEVLSALAEVNSETVVHLLEAALEGVDLEILVGDYRRHLVWGLEKIAFSPKTFEEGAHLLLRLAMAENESISNNATGQFLALFPVLLGDTAAGARQRLAFLDDVAQTDSAAQRELVVRALLAGAKTSHFSRGVGAESHGSRPALQPWHPQTWGEAWDYVRQCIARLTEFALREDDAGAIARKGLAHEFRSLVGGGLLDEVAMVVERVHGTHEYWPEALEALGDVLTYDAEGMEPERVEIVRTLTARLQPQGWRERIRFMVTEMPWDWPCDEKLGFDERGHRQVEAVRALADELLSQPDNLLAALHEMSAGNQRMAAVFGEAMADLAQEPQGWLEPLKSALVGTDPEKRNFSLLAGYLTGLARRHPEEVSAFKNEAAGSEVFAPGLPMVCWRLGIVDSDVSLVMSALSEGRLSADRLMQWTTGGVLAEVPSTAVAPLFDLLFDMGADGLSVGIDLLGMYVHGRAEVLTELRPQLRHLAEAASVRPRSRLSPMDEHHFKELMEWLLAKGRDDPDATAVALILAKGAAGSEGYEHSRLLEPIMPQLLSGFPEIVWPLLGQAIVDSKLMAWRMQHLLGDSYAFENKSNPALLKLPEETLMAWCYAHPDAAPAFVAGVVPVLSKPVGDSPERSLHPLMRRIIDEFGDREGVLTAVHCNMHSFGWTGSRTTYYALYQTPLAPLLEHPIGKVRRWAKSELRGLAGRIEEARAEDEERDAEWD